MSDRTVVRTIVETRTVSRDIGIAGKSAYQSYLDTTTDDPPMTEEEWAAGNGSGTVDAAAIAAITHAATAKDTPVDDDEVGLADSAATYGWKKIKWSAIKATLKAYFDTIYQTTAVTWSTLVGKPSTFPPTIGSGAADAVAGNDARLSDARNPTAHNHAWGDITSGVPASFTPSSHAHGNLTNDGKVGTTASLPLITGAGGLVVTGSFGSTSGTFCQGNDGRLSDARTPTAHTHTISQITDIGDAAVASAVSALYAGTAESTGSLATGIISGTLTINSTEITLGPGVAAALRDALKVPSSDPTGITGADAITNMVSLTAAEYAAITPNSTTLYVVT